MYEMLWWKSPLTRFEFALKRLLKFAFISITYTKLIIIDTLESLSLSPWFPLIVLYICCYDLTISAIILTRLWPTHWLNAWQTLYFMPLSSGDTSADMDSSHGDKVNIPAEVQNFLSKLKSIFICMWPKLFICMHYILWVRLPNVLAWLYACVKQQRHSAAAKGCRGSHLSWTQLWCNSLG